MSEVTIVTTGNIFTDHGQYFGLYGSFTWNSNNGNFLEAGVRGGALPTDPVEGEPQSVFIQDPNNNELTRLGDIPSSISNRSAPDGTQVYSLTAAGVPPAIPLNLDIARISNFNTQIFGGVAVGISPDGDTKVTGGIRIDGKFASNQGAPFLQQLLITDGNTIKIDPLNVLAGINDIPEGGDPLTDGKSGDLLISGSYNGPFRNQAPQPETQAGDELPFAIQLAKAAIPVTGISSNVPSQDMIVLKSDRTTPLAGTVRSVEESPTGNLRVVLRPESETRELPGIGPIAFGKQSESAQQWQEYITANIIPPAQISSELKQQIEQLPGLRNLIKYETDFAVRYPAINNLIGAIDQRTSLIAKEISPQGEVSENLATQILQNQELRSFIQKTELAEIPSLRNLIQIADQQPPNKTPESTAFSTDPIIEWKNHFLIQLQQNIANGQLSPMFSEFVTTNIDWIAANAPELIPQLKTLLSENKPLSDR